MLEKWSLPAPMTNTCQNMATIHYLFFRITIYVTAATAAKAEVAIFATMNDSRHSFPLCRINIQQYDKPLRHFKHFTLKSDQTFRSQFVVRFTPKTLVMQ